MAPTFSRLSKYTGLNWFSTPEPVPAKILPKMHDEEGEIELSCEVKASGGAESSSPHESSIGVDTPIEVVSSGEFASESSPHIAQVAGQFREMTC